ncbi:tryptophan synthase subunit alpha [Clostridium saccharoperbutylacetonicum]|uniref:Tryptophan synthase alpha chain n=2 Tax=Clostridium TaxID=1485 RepID=M1MQ14_9CLOT|nr:tryptophan synthase subunit alpha [Clostridium saccharoperbutylacetonicum]AGF56816.1 tryptophan synthase alpha chain [Clostridium saccharoperbutylacetonicum N1-4(HMT)]AQR95476.1 tryptophan synthase alpha chain [Clostridium saccharoperbutylacetonicum]NRT62427.1 tryptophan synthase alpha chain [Clostridium saccharoperbutylacetonicum]NSB25768.1 tryptophan synthase alpha chain [Clostridium saccharoperbutylacetonicum]NSB31335.1 tryptophan synthase alpha chain [Clostridium saccharoperbutylacetoni
MNRIDISFNELKKNNKKALIPFVTCGADLTIEETAELIIELDREGSTLVEIGVPFSDPLADGPVIQNAYTKALNNGTKLRDVFNCVKLVREKSQIPVVLMVYFNVVYFNGIENFIKEAAMSGADGLIVPDVPLEERGELNKICEINGIYLIPLVARTSRDRIAVITKDAKGFVYCVSTNGTTGERTTLDSGTQEYLAEVRKIVNIPMCIGFGISSREVVKEIKDYCDGVIVGSAIVKRMAEGKQPVIEFIRDLKDGLY